MNPAEHREASLRHGDERWRRLAGALDAHLDEPLSAATDWTGHDVYAHFARWQQMTIDNLRRVLAGEQPAPAEADDNTLNNRWRAEDRALASAEVRHRCSATREELRAALMALSPDQWQTFGRLFAPDINGEHYEHHLAVCAPLEVGA